MDPIRNFGFLLKDVSRLSSLNFERHAGELKLTLSQCKLLAHLQRNEGVTQVRLARLTDTDPMTLVRTLDHMEREGLVERRADPVDRRARRLYLKPAAEPMLERIWEVADQARGEALAGLSATERRQLISLLERIQSNLRVLLPCADSDEVTCAPPDKATRRAAAKKDSASPRPRSKAGDAVRRKRKGS